MDTQLEFNNLSKVIFKIECDNGNMGSGTLLWSEENNSFIGITAKHVILGEKFDEEFKGIIARIEERQIKIVASNIFFHKELDLALIIFDELSFITPIVIPCKTNKSKEKSIFKGFPNSLGSGSTAINCYYSDINELEPLTKIDSIHDFPIDNCKGLSGSGVFIEKGQKLFLVGVVIELIENFTKFKIVEILHINEILSDNSFRSLEIKDENFYDEKFTKINFNLKKHTENILNEIQTHIDFNGLFIEVDRSNDLKEIVEANNQVIVLSGPGGAGKTAIVKSLYTQLKEKNITFYVFKATEFGINNINEIFRDYDFYDFLNMHKEKEKIVIIDSAEKLLDLNNYDPFKEFLTSLIENNWKIIFTTRNNYLEDLNFEFLEIYNITPLNLHLENIGLEELEKIAIENSFILPKDDRIVQLIRNPFYLKEYLAFYDENENISYVEFKEKLWDKTVKKGKPKRVETFIKFVFDKVKQGSFFITPTYDLDDELIKDGILGYEDEKGYFITHDIYEEWALEKKINREFSNAPSDIEFLQNIGSCLPIRRSFRNWVSEKLLFDNQQIHDFIERNIIDSEIEKFWKDELIVSVLLSEYVERFFERMREKLLNKENQLLLQISFWLRIACKEVDNIFGLNKTEVRHLPVLFTKPKGNGWGSFIKFIYNNLDTLGVEKIKFVLPVIYDWNDKNRSGETSKFCSLIALKYYEYIIKDHRGYFSDKDIERKLFKTLANGSKEIEKELSIVLNKIIENNWKNYRDPYYGLSEFVLTSIEGLPIAKNLPIYVLKIADLFWTKTPKNNKKNFFNYESNSEIEDDFNLDEHHADYYPSSAYKTPIYGLLQSAQNETIDFILNFTNKAVEYYVNTKDRKEGIEEIEVIFENSKITQYIGRRIWHMYRGGQSSTNLLESIHMALEKYILERVENTDAETLENLLMYLLKRSNSASISAIVTSIVLAYPEKTFNIACILFKTKEFFFYDNTRYHSDLYKTRISGYLSHNRLYEEERKESDALPHRKNKLEAQALEYQVICKNGMNEEKVRERQKIIQDIFDKHYGELNESNYDEYSKKIWQLSLARMDYRKMNPIIENQNGQTVITFEPIINRDLKNFTEESSVTFNESTKYFSLSLWAGYKFKNDCKAKEYLNYDGNFKLVLEELKDILGNTSSGDTLYLMKNEMISNISAVLLRDYVELLSYDEKVFCKNLLLELITLPLQLNYSYQISDGLETVIKMIPNLLKNFSDEKNRIKETLLKLLFLERNINVLVTDMISKDLWKICSNDTKDILLGYLLLKPKYYEFLIKNRFKIKEDLLNKFLLKHKKQIKNVIESKICLNDIEEFENMNFKTAVVVFRLMPFSITDDECNIVIKECIKSFSKLFSSEKQEKINYDDNNDFMEKFVVFILKSTNKDKIKEYLNPIIEVISDTEQAANLLKEFVCKQDRLEEYENFWFIWNLFKEKVIQCGNKSYRSDLINNYLFGGVDWNTNTISWHTIRQENKTFFIDMSNKIGESPTTLYALSKLLNDVGSCFLNDGIFWISEMIKNHKSNYDKDLKVNTIYYIENLYRKYIYLNRESIKKNIRIKNAVLVGLNFLIERESVTGYLLRESIL